MINSSGNLNEQLGLEYTEMCFLNFVVNSNSLSQGSFALGLGLHPLPQRVSIVSIHLNLTKEVKLNVETTGKLFNFCVRPRLLCQKKEMHFREL